MSLNFDSFMNKVMEVPPPLTEEEEEKIKEKNTKIAAQYKGISNSLDVFPLNNNSINSEIDFFLSNPQKQEQLSNDISDIVDIDLKYELNTLQFLESVHKEINRLGKTVNAAISAMKNQSDLKF